MNTPAITPTPNQPIFVTQPALPPLQEFLPYLEEIWTNKISAKGWHFRQKLEKSLSNTGRCSLAACSDWLLRTPSSVSAS